MPESAVPSASHQRQTQPLREQRGWNLETGHGAGKAGAQQTERGIADAELSLPERQHNVDQIGVAVVQRMRAAGNADRTALVSLAGSRVGPAAGRSFGCRAHAALLRRSTKATLTKEITGSPF